MKIQRRTLFPSGQPSRAKKYIALLERTGDESINALFKRVTIKPSYRSMIRETVPASAFAFDPDYETDPTESLEILHAASETVREHHE